MKISRNYCTDFPPTAPVLFLYPGRHGAQSETKLVARVLLKPGFLGEAEAVRGRSEEVRRHPERLFPMLGNRGGEKCGSRGKWGRGKWGGGALIFS